MSAQSTYLSIHFHAGVFTDVPFRLPLVGLEWTVFRRGLVGAVAIDATHRVRTRLSIRHAIRALAACCLSAVCVLVVRTSAMVTISALGGALVPGMAPS